jgi:GNAT superfamily N-acetyltransferase
VTGLEKRDYWRLIYRRYADSGHLGRHFLVADLGGRVVGFIIGEVRDWEFGSPPCGWVFAIDVKPDARQSGIGAQLLEAICADFRRAGVSKVRTMLGSDNTLILSFFRSQGMMAGPFIPLEMDLGS